MQHHLQSSRTPRRLIYPAAAADRGRASSRHAPSWRAPFGFNGVAALGAALAVPRRSLRRSARYTDRAGDGRPRRHAITGTLNE